MRKLLLVLILIFSITSIAQTFAYAATTVSVETSETTHEIVDDGDGDLVDVIVRVLDAPNFFSFLGTITLPPNFSLIEVRAEPALGSGAVISYSLLAGNTYTVFAPSVDPNGTTLSSSTIFRAICHVNTATNTITPYTVLLGDQAVPSNPNGLAIKVNAGNAGGNAVLLSLMPPAGISTTVNVVNNQVPQIVAPATGAIINTIENDIDSNIPVTVRWQDGAGNPLQSAGTHNLSSLNHTNVNGLVFVTAPNLDQPVVNATLKFDPNFDHATPSNSPAPYPVTLTARAPGPAAYTTSLNFTIRVTQVNRNPRQNTAIGQIIATEGIEKTVNLNWTDDAGETLTYSYSLNPLNALDGDQVSLNPLGGEFHWTPDSHTVDGSAATDRSIGTITFQIADNAGGAANESAELRVINANQPPMLRLDFKGQARGSSALRYPGSLETEDGQASDLQGIHKLDVYKVAAGETFEVALKGTDSDLDSLTLRALYSGAPVSNAVLPNSSFVADPVITAGTRTGKFLFAPSVSQVGQTFEIELGVTDSGLPNNRTVARNIVLEVKDRT